jgi:hypothetical protein
MRFLTPCALGVLLSGTVVLTPAAPAPAGQPQISKPVLLVPKVITLQSIRTMLADIKTALSAYASEEGLTGFVIRNIDTTNCIYLHITDGGVTTSLTIGNVPKMITLSHTRRLRASTDPSKRLQALNDLNSRFPLVKFTLRARDSLVSETTFSISEGILLQQVVANYEQFLSNVSEFGRTHARPHFELLEEPGGSARPAPGASEHL